jgi:hypothetical protein
MSERIKVSDNFFLDEFINPNDYAKYGAKSIALVDNRLFKIAQYFRTELGLPVTINNWYTGGQYKESGLREQNTTTGAKLSAHKNGLAIDIKVKGMSGQQMYAWAKSRAKELYELGVRRIETPTLTPTWLHLDLKLHQHPNAIAVIDLKSVVHLIQIL